MEFEELKALICLAQKQDWQSAAASSGQSASALKAVIARVEARYQQPIVRPGDPFGGFTPAGEQVLAWGREFCLEASEIQQQFGEASRRALLAGLLERRSVSPKRLCAPGPSAADLHSIAQAGLHAPDHGSLHPWRLLEFKAEQRLALADCFAAEKRRRDPLCADEDIERAREHATRPPVLLAFVVSPQAKARVPVREQWLTAGAALGNLLHAAHQLGFGAIVLSGERCYDALLCAQLGLQPPEALAGFISLGSIAQQPPARRERDPGEVLSPWVPVSPAASAPGIQTLHPLDDRARGGQKADR